MISGHNDDVKRASQVSAILIGGSSRSGAEAAAMAIKHHRPFACVGSRRPHVQEEAIFSGCRFVPSSRSAGLWRRRAEFQCIAHTSPRLKRRRGFEAVRSRDRTGVGNASESHQTSTFGAANTPVYCFSLDDVCVFRLSARTSSQRSCAGQGVRSFGQPVASGRAGQMTIEKLTLSFLHCR